MYASLNFIKKVFEEASEALGIPDVTLNLLKGRKVCHCLYKDRIIELGLAATWWQASEGDTRSTIVHELLHILDLHHTKKMRRKYQYYSHCSRDKLTPQVMQAIWADGEMPSIVQAAIVKSIDRSFNRPVSRQLRIK